MKCALPNENNEFLLKKVLSEIEKLSNDTTARLLKQDGKIAEVCVYIKENLSSTLFEMVEAMKLGGQLDNIITTAVLTGLSNVQTKTEHIISVKEYGATGNGITDDTSSIQLAIDEANKKGRKVFIPKGIYVIKEPIVLNGCSIVGEPGNIFNEKGTVIKCLTNDFTAIKQGSTAVADIMFNVANILVMNAKVGFEFNYCINSEFKQLYAKNCDIGFKLGDSSAVGSMFCKFNGFYTDSCRVGVESNSKDYFNNNEFNNGFIQGTEYAMLLKVVGGYGAVGNVFNNVEFRSQTGRGIVLTSTLNTVFNSCYFECGGYSIYATDYSSITVNNCTYALYKSNNAFNDKNIIYSVGGYQMLVNGGIVFLDENYNNIYFYGAGNEATHQNISVLRSISKNGSATGFDFFEKQVATDKNEQVVLTSTVNVASEETATVNFTFAKPYNKIPEIVIPVLRGSDAGVITFILAEKTATGGTIKVVNKSTVAKSISFSIYAKVI